MSIRLDKWLWAARFFKTRALAKSAIEGGKVKLNVERTKPSKETAVGQVLTIRQGRDDKTVEVLSLTDQRRGAPEAAALYRETQQSLAVRERRAAERKALKGAMALNSERPTKKQRRQIHRFREQGRKDQ